MAGVGGADPQFASEPAGRPPRSRTGYLKPDRSRCRRPKRHVRTHRARGLTASFIRLPSDRDASRPCGSPQSLPSIDVWTWATGLWLRLVAATTQPQNAGLATSAKLAALDLEAAEVGRRVSSIYATANAAGISMRWLESLLARRTYAVPTRLKQRRGNATTSTVASRGAIARVIIPDANNARERSLETPHKHWHALFKCHGELK